MRTCSRIRRSPSARHVVQQPGTCMHCHASVYVPYKKLGGGDPDASQGLRADEPDDVPGGAHEGRASRGVHRLPRSAVDAAARHAAGFLEGIKKVKAAQGLADYDVNRDATRQEMRAYVCGQCHVEYYFKGAEKRLTYPWDKGLKADEILSYYEENGFKDWTHAESGAPTLEGATPRVRDVEPGHPRALGRRLRRLPHAVSARRVAEDQRPSRPQPAAQRQPRLPDVSSLGGGRAARARPHDSGPHVPGAQRRDGRADRADRRHQDGQSGRRERRRTSTARAASAPRANSCSTSSKPRTRWASTPIRRRCACWRCRSTRRGAVKQRCPAARPRLVRTANSALRRATSDTLKNASAFSFNRDITVTYDGKERHGRRRQREGLHDDRGAGDARRDARSRQRALRSAHGRRRCPLQLAVRLVRRQGIAGRHVLLIQPQTHDVASAIRHISHWAP